MSEEQFEIVSPPVYTSYIETNKDFPRRLENDSNFTIRDLKGYNGEVIVRNQLDRLNVSYVSNPLDNIQSWKQCQGHGVDFRIESFNIELEVKNITGKVFKSWIIRDWLPRFSFNHERRVVAVPRSTKLPKTSLELLFTHDIGIVYFDSIKYIIPDMKGNKLVEVVKPLSFGIFRPDRNVNGNNGTGNKHANVKMGKNGSKNSIFNDNLDGCKELKSPLYQSQNKESNTSKITGKESSKEDSLDLPDSFDEQYIKIFNELNEKYKPNTSKRNTKTHGLDTKLIDYLPPKDRDRMQYREEKKRRLKSLEEELTPTCTKCKQKTYCNKKGEDALRCLKHRVFLLWNLKYDLFWDIDPNDKLLYIGVDNFYDIVRKKQYDKLGITERISIDLIGYVNSKGFLIDDKQHTLSSYLKESKREG